MKILIIRIFNLNCLIVFIAKYLLTCHYLYKIVLHRWYNFLRVFSRIYVFSIANVTNRTFLNLYHIMYSYGWSSSNHKRIYSEQHCWPKIKASTLCFILQFLWKRKQTLAFMLRYFESKEAIFFGFSFFITNLIHMCLVFSLHPKTYYVSIKNIFKNV